MQCSRIWILDKDIPSLSGFGDTVVSYDWSFLCQGGHQKSSTEVAMQIIIC